MDILMALSQPHVSGGKGGVAGKHGRPGLGGSGGKGGASFSWYHSSVSGLICTGTRLTTCHVVTKPMLSITLTVSGIKCTGTKLTTCQMITEPMLSVTLTLMLRAAMVARVRRELKRK
jgi:hypothetical protein